MSGVEKLVTRLDASNYHQWKDDVMAALILKRYDSTILQDAAYTALTADERMSNKLAVAFMRFTIQFEFRHIGDGATTALEFWEAYQTFFSDKPAGAQFIIRRQIEHAERVKNEDPHTFLARMETPRGQLYAATGERMNDSTFIDKILIGLGPQYDEFTCHFRFNAEDMDMNTFKKRPNNATTVFSPGPSKHRPSRHT